MIEITDAQFKVLAYIKSCIEIVGIPPSRVEIMADMDYESPNAAQDHIKALESKGFLIEYPGVARGLVLTDKAKDVINERI